ncbi:hypothetical protein F4560_002917 [Saccharothrix ecbatanensis]|uniref:Ternary complex associated domain-containing protein n=1 Tax=Saccharothrix ecbatanensis TaxID=1105145 RepID=A0A7W9HIY2_9PSEU|nr:hypothetical protein [Saccharothrix ecbatanensis]MBB5803149.1 hypothetical protein [Saccharothrix ecbatanensis]
MDVEITFAPDINLTVRRIAEIRTALRRIPPRPLPGGWSVTPDHIEVTGLIGGGLSGAVVAQVLLHRGDQQLRRIAKIAPAAEMMRELRNYTDIVQSHVNAVCAPIDASSVPADGSSDQLEALVYDHVAQFAGSPDTEAITLEDLVRHGDSDRAVLAVERLFTGMASPFHQRTALRKHKSLRDLNATLGPDIVLRAGEVDCDHTLGEEIFQTSLGADGVVAGSGIRLKDVEWWAGTPLGRLEDITVLLEGGDPGSVVSGHVVRTRFDWHAERIAGAFGSFTRVGGAHGSDDWVVADGVRCGDPSAGLRKALTDTRFGRALTVVHGDLNPRNVMVVPGGDQVILIDYARTAEEQPVLVDPAWLEVCLLRNVHSELGFAELLRLQRALGLAGRLLSLGCAADDVGTACAGVVGDGPVSAAFRVLFAIRAQAARAYPFRDEWWAAHAAMLLLCAHRTVKWDDDNQTDARLRVAAAVASVAGEWLADAGPFTHWVDLEPVLHAVTSVLRPATSEAVGFVSALAAAVGPSVAVDDLRDQVLRNTRREEAGRVVIGFADDAVELVELDGDAVGPEGGEFGQVWRLVADRMECTLVAESGGGKTTAMRALAYRMALDVVGERARTALDGPMRMVAHVDARAIADRGDDALPERALLVLGAAHLVVDDFGLLPPPARARVGRRLRELRRRYPRTPVVVLERDSDHAPPMFPEVRIRPLTPQQVYDHIERLVVLRRTQPAYGRLLLDRLPTTWPESHRVLQLPAGLAEFIRIGHIALTSAAVFTAGLGEEEKTGLPAVAAHVLDDGGDARAFRSRAQLDHFAALALDRMSDHEVRLRARRFRWRESCLLAVELAGTGSRITQAIVTEAIDTDPPFAGALLARLRHPPADLVSRFLVAQREVLDQDWRSGAEVDRAVRALVAFGRPDAYHVLVETGSFNGMAALRRGMRPGPDRDRVDEAFRQVAAPALDPVASDGTKVAALRAVVGVPGLELLIGELVSDPTWAVADEAWTALLRLGSAVPPRLQEAYVHHLRDRLAAVEAELPRTAVVARKVSLQDERVNLLRHLADPEALLERRFRYEIADEVADSLHGLGAFVGEVDSVYGLADLPVREAELIAHQALTEHADAFVAAASATSGEHLLLIAAAALPHAGSAAVPHVVQVVRDLVPVVEEDRFEGCAALLNAVAVVDAAEGARLAETCAETLFERNVRGRLTWPWSTSIARARAGSTGLGALAADDFHRDGRRPNEVPAELDGLVEHSATPLWAVAVATAGLTEALPRIRPLVAEYADQAPVLVSSPRYGVLELAPAADMLSSVGYLARLAHDQGEQEAEVANIVRLLHDTGLDAKHSSLREARLIGAGYLGDWVPLVEALDDGERLRVAAAHAVSQWTPGPATPTALRESVAIAQWLADRLADPGLSRSAREVLVALTDVVEQRAGARAGRGVAGP